MLRAVIFDCDGVLADSERAHFRAFQKVLSREGITLTEEAYFARYLALDDRGCFAAVFKDAERPLDGPKLRELLERKAARYLEEAKDGVDLIPGVVDLVRALSQRFPCAVASGALRHEVDLVLDAASLTGTLRVVVTAEDVSRGKPHPESYETALARLNAESGSTPAISPGECLVVEDSRHGVAAARAAGMRCLAITTSYPADALGDADLVVESFVGLDPQSIVEHFSRD